MSNNLEESKKSAFETLIHILKTKVDEIKNNKCIKMHQINAFYFAYSSSSAHEGCWFTQLSGNSISVSVWEKTQKECLLVLAKWIHEYPAENFTDKHGLWIHCGKIIEPY